MTVSGFLLFVIDLAYRVLLILLLVRALASWLPGSGPAYYRLFGVLRRLTDPILEPIRRLLPVTGGIDFSPLVAILLLGILRRLLVNLALLLPH